MTIGKGQPLPDPIKIQPVLEIAARAVVEEDDVVAQFEVDVKPGFGAIRPDLPDRLYELYSEYSCIYSKDTNKMLVTVRYKAKNQDEVDKLGLSSPETIDVKAYPMAEAHKSMLEDKVANFDAAPVAVVADAAAEEITP